MKADIGEVHVIGRGFWTDDIVSRYFIELRLTAALARRNVDRVRVLEDLREAWTQSPAVAARIKAQTRPVRIETDRIAVVLQSTLAKMQINRVGDSGNHASFVALKDARRWLGLRALGRRDQPWDYRGAATQADAKALVYSTGLNGPIVGPLIVTQHLDPATWHRKADGEDSCIAGNTALGSQL